MDDGGTAFRPRLYSQMTTMLCGYSRREVAGGPPLGRSSVGPTRRKRKERKQGATTQNYEGGRTLEDVASGEPLTWPHGHGYSEAMKSIAAGKFKNVCLRTLDEVAATKSSIVITKRGRPVAKLVPYVEPAKKRGLAGSVVKEVGNPFGTGERWDADAS